MSRQILWILLAVCALGLATTASAQTGKIAGTVTDAETGEPFPGVNVRIDGTTQGASTGLDGRYSIIGVRPGEYAVVVSFIGYQAQRIEGVRVRIDLTTTVDAEIRPEAIEGEEVVVEVTRDFFQRDVTATTATVSGDEIRELPVENFADVVGLQAGVVGTGGELHFRGGRAGEVGYWVDGVPVGDVYDGGLALEIENESVQELQVVTGAFNAEYGQALSGIVNVVTRDGTNDFEAGAEVWAGDYALGRRLRWTTPTGARRWRSSPAPAPGDLNPLGRPEPRGHGLAGPVLRDRLFFFASGPPVRQRRPHLRPPPVHRPRAVGFNELRPDRPSSRLDTIRIGRPAPPDARRLVARLPQPLRARRPASSS